MRILITGASGYLGGRLAEHFAACEGYDVLLGTRHPALVSAPRNGRVVGLAWNAPDALEEACRGVDAVVHTAGMNARDCAADPAGALEVNGGNTARLVAAASRVGVARFIYLSTAHVYGAPLRGRITEATRPANTHPYAASHRTGENAVRAARARHDLDGVVIRLSNAYGPPVRPDADCWALAVNDLARQAATTGRMRLRTSGLQRRDFIPLSDVCRAIEHLMRLPGSGVVDGIVNVGGGWAPTVWEVTCVVRERCADVLGREPEVERAPIGADDATDDLDYRIDALLRTGFRPDKDRTREIDRLLVFCAAAFGER